MNLYDLHKENKPVSAITFFREGKGTAISIRLQRGAELKKHITTIPAVLLCIKGRVEYGDENDQSVELLDGDYHLITPDVPHWVRGINDSLLVLIK